MTDFTHEEQVRRQEAAERLVDIAYALTAGSPLELRTRGRHIDVPVADEVVLVRRSTTHGERVDVHIQLSWSGRRPSAGKANGASGR
jgi:amphi-Trp domain-containing protein